MSDMSIEVDANPVTKAARDLSAIVNLYDDLRTQAVHHANDTLMPGGLAMVALADISSLDEWAEQLEATEHRAIESGKSFPVEDDDTWEPPLQMLLYWSERWRKARGYDIRSHPTLSSEVGFIRNSLSWAWDNETRWDKFVVDLGKARTRAENLLKAGNRDIFSDDVNCLVCNTRLRRRMTSRGYEDEWWCADCYSHLTPGRYLMAKKAAAKAAKAHILQAPTSDVS